MARTGDDRDRTELAIAYAEALGFATPRIALGRLEIERQVGACAALPANVWQVLVTPGSQVNPRK